MVQYMKCSKLIEKKQTKLILTHLSNYNIFMNKQRIFKLNKIMSRRNMYWYQYLETIKRAYYISWIRTNLE